MTSQRFVSVITSVSQRCLRARLGPGFLVAAATLLLAGCAKPTLNTIQPGTGYPRQLLAVDGTTDFAAVVWDAGSGSEMTIYTGLFGTRYFQIPADATPGPHQVAIRNNGGTSATIEVMVLDSQPFPAPRIEDIGIVEASGSPLSIGMTVSAANLDVNATLEVREVVAGVGAARNVPISVFWSGLPIDYQQAHQPATFGYPVYHYAQVAGVVEGVSWGSTLEVTVVNNDGQTARGTITLPARAEDLDGDGDGLPDVWEESGYEAPSGVTISLSDFGANKWRKDILVETDWIAAAKLPDTVFSTLETLFAEAPVLNPDGSRGIHVFVDRGQSPGLKGGETLANHDCLTLEFPAPAGISGCTIMSSVFDYKANHFDPDRLKLFHYAVLGRKDTLSASGRAELHGNDFFLTLLSASSTSGNFTVQLVTFMHELGHNLGLSHGDLMSNTQDYVFKPNLPSIMSYRYGAGVDVTCDLQQDGVITFSQGTLRRLSEAAVDETVGVCDGKGADLDQDGMVASAAGPMNLNPLPWPGFDMDMVDDWDDFDQWGHLLLNFVGGAEWNNN